MGRTGLQDLAKRYRRDGFLSPVRLFSPEAAADHRCRMEAAEAKIGPLHYRVKTHTFLRSPLELATAPQILDIVEQLIGPDILLYNATYIVKEPRTPDHVSWHQDLTYWGLSQDDQVSLWLALSPATVESGCMRMVPGSHRQGQIEHRRLQDATNLLFQGQTVDKVAEEQAVSCPLMPGEASFHHGWTLHASLPNRSRDRRIGLNVQYLATHLRQTKQDGDSAMLVRGHDRYRHFAADLPAAADLDPAAMARQSALEARYRAIAGTA